MNEDTYRRALGALAARRPLLYARASEHALCMAPFLPGECARAQRALLWREFVWACRIWQAWGGVYA
jgi:hypothetical protein